MAPARDRRNVGLVTAVLLAAAGAACSGSADGDRAGRTAEPDQRAIVALDGSSTVYPITEAVAEEFQREHFARITVGVSGTGGGFQKFCNAETVATGASRPIKPSEVTLCAEHGVEYVELPVAYDGIAVVIHPDNHWATSMTVAELRALWSPDAQEKVTRWSRVRTGWPDNEVHLFGPGVDSGTYDYFTKAVVGQEHSSRGDFTSSEDDNVLVQGVATDKLALGFFGYAYYAENRERLKLVAIDDGDDGNGAGPIQPSPTTVADGTYQPLSRPIFIYASKQAAERPEVDSFVSFYLRNAATLADEVGYIALPERVYGLAQQRWEQRVTGSLFAGQGARIGVSVADLLASTNSGAD